ncbi:hypothetical protein JMJ35_006810 [Cladonia borealis]|uniref:F-box domain-containing protein n=1 Tax=Cladonia borealis TaxID=184061 RepID=A0AA39QWB6_9LECA|nr:hypothetical protein JMJ35_006810 [Cladonia borealis]
MSGLASSLYLLPPELFEFILEDLGDAEISRLRLTCKNFRDRSHHRFRSRFTCRQTDLSTNSLQRLIDISGHEQFGSAIRTVTVVAVLYDTAYLHGLLDYYGISSPSGPSDNPTLKYDKWRGPQRIPEIPGIKELTSSEVAQVRWEQSLLSPLEAEQHGPKVLEVGIGYGVGHRPVGRTDVAEEEEKTRLCRTMLTLAFCQLGRLQSLVLEAAVYKVAAVRLAAYNCTDTGLMWKKASYVFHEVMTAIAESRMTVDQLSIYGGPWGCSVSSDILHELVNCWRDQNREEILDAVKALALCVSEPAMVVARGTHHFSSIAGFLALCPNVEELEIHAYRIGPSASRFQHIFEAVAKEVRFSGLLTCTLKGLQLREIDLIHFLENNSRLANLKLRNVTLKQGSWHEFFRCCSSRVVALEMLSIQRLYIFRNELLIFENEDENGVISIQGEELKRGINFRSTFHRRVWERLCEDYGPPYCVPDRLRFDGIGRGS